MNIKFRQVSNAAGEPDPRARLQPAFPSLGALIGPDHTGQVCRVCQRKLVGPKPPPATISQIPVSSAPARASRP